MKEFLEVGRDLQIREIKDVPEEENTLIEEYGNETNHHISPEEESSDDDDINHVEEIKKGMSVPSLQQFNKVSSM